MGKVKKCIQGEAAAEEIFADHQTMASLALSQQAGDAGAGGSHPPVAQPKRQGKRAARAKPVAQPAVSASSPTATAALPALVDVLMADPAPKAVSKPKPKVAAKAETRHKKKKSSDSLARPAVNRLRTFLEIKRLERTDALPPSGSPGTLATSVLTSSSASSSPSIPSTSSAPTASSSTPSTTLRTTTSSSPPSTTLPPTSCSSPPSTTPPAPTSTLAAPPHVSSPRAAPPAPSSPRLASGGEQVHGSPGPSSAISPPHKKLRFLLGGGSEWKTRDELTPIEVDGVWIHHAQPPLHI